MCSKIKHKVAISNKSVELHETQDAKPREFLIAPGKADATLNRHTVHGVLIGLIKSNLQKFETLLETIVTDDRLHFLYQRINFVRRSLITSRPVITESLWIKTQTLF